LTSCAADKPRINPAVSHPERSRVAPEGTPLVPAASVACAEDPSRRCVTDADTAEFIRSLVAALDRANRKLCWLGVFHGYAPCESAPE